MGNHGHWNGSKYLLVVDYFSRFTEIAQLKSKISEETIHHLKNIFARQGIPVTAISDNGPQFSSREFRQFSKSYGFTHHTSSPKHPQGNDEAERAVKTIKCLLKKESEPQLALLSYRATPLRNSYSPAELLMGRKLRTTVPIIPKLLHPTSLNYSKLAEKEKYLRKKQKATFDGCHRAREPLVLSIDTRH
jgi:transposase InsO family protein